MKLHVYADPGHAWVKVSKKNKHFEEVARLITSYSYTRGDYVYLEEDFDAPTFLNHLWRKGIEFSFKAHRTDRRSRIRSYDNYYSSER